MVYNLLKLVLLLPVATFFFQSQLFTSTDPKAASFSLVQIQKHFLLLLLAVGHTNYPLAIDYVDTGLCVLFLTSLSPPTRDRFLGAPHLPSRQRTTSLVWRVRGALMSACLCPHRR